MEGLQRVKKASTARYENLKFIIDKYKPKTICEVGTEHGNGSVFMINEALKHHDEIHFTGYDLFEGIMTARERQAEAMAKAILKHGNNIFFTSDTYKPGTDLVDGSYSLLVQHYVIKHGGDIVNGIDTPVQVIVRVHETDQISADNETIIFDPWRSYPKADNVVYYGHN